MDEIEYKKWKISRKNLLIEDGETEQYAEYVMSWMDSIKGRRENELLSKYHPELQNKSEEEVYYFIHLARFFPEGLPETDFSRQVMDSAFFLYRPCLKLEFLNIQEIK